MILTNDRGAWNPSSNKCAAVRALDLCPKPNIAAVNQPRQRIRSFHKANDNRQKLKYPRDLVRDLCGISGDPRQSGIQPCIEQAPIEERLGQPGRVRVLHANAVGVLTSSVGLATGIVYHT